MPNPFIPVPGCAQLELVYSYQGQVVENTLHYTNEAPGAEENLQALCTTAITVWVDTFRGLQTPDLSLTSVKATSLENQTDPGLEIAVLADSAGTHSGGPEASNVACCITFLTGLRGRSYRGRIYLPGVPHGVIASSRFDGAYMTALAEKYDDWKQLGGAGIFWDLVVVSRFTNHAPRTTGICTPVVGWKVNPVVASQRRRLPGRGK